MSTYVAFLRAVNVGGHNRMTMDDLRAVVESIGYRDVRTYIQSGNVVFEADPAAEATLQDTIHDAIEDTFGYDLTVIVRTRVDLAAIVANHPFEIRSRSERRQYVTFLTEDPTDQQIGDLVAAENRAESFDVGDRVVYSHLDREALGDGRWTDVTAVLDVEGTRRNWNVIEAVLDLCE